jgi:hypothetical protein
MGHDSINAHVVMEVRAKREGIELTCKTCGGDGDAFRDEEHRAAHDAWQPSEPPTGEGWQMWENTSEGSPISPVFATPEELAEWLAPNASPFADTRATKEEWLKMIVGPGYAVSSVYAGGRMMSGVEAMAEE